MSSNGNAKRRRVSLEQPEMSLVDSSYTRELGFKSGSIISMHLENFQVATNCNYKFGPALNMILGPNGTGKSTVVTAIFLIFGGRLIDLHRKGYGGFIQTGAEKGVIKVLLQAKEGGMINPELTMELFHQRKPRFLLNEIETPAKEIQDLVLEYRIQVNNLCQFLPQTRVAAFSGESPQERLVSTEYAVGYLGMVDDHEQLMTAGDRLSRLQTTNTQLQHYIDEYKERLEQLQETMRSLDESASKRKEQQYFKNLVPVLQYAKVRTTCKELKKEISSKKKSLEDFEVSCSDVVEKLQASRESRILYQKQKASDKELSKRMVELIQESRRKMDSARDNVVLSRRRLSELTSEQGDAEGRISRLQDDRRTLHKRLHHLEKNLQHAQNEISEQMIEDRLAEAEHQISQLRSKEEEFSTILTDLESKQRSSQRSAQQIQRRLHKLQNQSSRDPHVIAQSLSPLHRQELFAALDLVNSQKSQFSGIVHSPGILSLSILNDAALPQLFSRMRVEELLTFVCEQKSDQKLLTSLSAKLTVPIRTVWVPPKRQKDRGPLSRSELSDYGFDGYLIDCLNGPEGVLNYFASLGFGRSPYSSTRLSRETEIRLESSGYLGEYIDSSHRVERRRSHYGQRKIYSVETGVPTVVPQWLRDMCQQDISNQLIEAQVRLNEFNREIESLNNQLIDTSAKREDVKVDRLKLVGARTGWSDKILQRDKFQALVEAANANISTINLNIEKEKDRHVEFGRHLKEKTEALAGSLRELVEVSSQPSKHYDVIVQSAKRFGQYSWSFASAESSERRYSEALDTYRTELRNSLDQLKAELAAQEEKISSEKQAYEEAKAELRKLGMEERAKEDAKKITAEEVQEKIGALLAELRLTESGENYKETSKLLDDTQKKLESFIQDLNRDSALANDLDNQVKALREKWEAELLNLVAYVSQKYSAMFNALGCRGELSLVKRGFDFANWGIDVLVAFRDGEPLSPLSRQKQSGGERAVSTAVYLLALQDLANSPFRVVDEINQGMDEMNEYRTQRFIVETACESGSQCFLVTPKLLMDLPYHHDQEIEIIFNGTHVAENMVYRDDNFDLVTCCIEEEVPIERLDSE